MIGKGTKKDWKVLALCGCDLKPISNSSKKFLNQCNI